VDPATNSEVSDANTAYQYQTGANVDRSIKHGCPPSWLLLFFALAGGFCLGARAFIVGLIRHRKRTSERKTDCGYCGLAEGSSIRAIERMTGINRNTIMNLGVRVGQGCAKILDAKMRGLTCHFLQFDEIWGFIGKKEKHRMITDDPTLGDVWTFCAIDAETKLMPAFKVGKRDHVTANAFVGDVASRLKNRPQVSSDGLRAYVEAVENAFGMNMDFGMVIKSTA
jgi:IS1 family transposase